MTRFYDTARWQKCRRMQLSRSPMCEACLTKPAKHVDHIVPVSRGGDIWRSSNWQSLCQDCHNAKTAAERTGRTWTPPKHRGCFPDGSPRDPAHPWYTGTPGGRSITASPALTPARDPQKSISYQK